MTSPQQTVKVLSNNGVDIGDVTLNGPLGRQADAASVSIALSAEDVALLQSGQNIGGYTAVIAPTLAVTAAAYSAGHLVGNKLTLTGIARADGKLALLQSLFLIDTSNQKAALELLIFNANPSATTFTDHATLSINAADVGKIVRRVSIAAADYVTIDTKAFADISPGGKVLKPASGVDMYACLVAVGTPTYAATTALTLNLGVLQD